MHIKLVSVAEWPPFEQERYDTHGVISIDSIIFNSMSTDSSAVKVLDS